MEDVTRNAIQRLMEASWFRERGRPYHLKNVKVVESWREACEACSTDEWEEIGLDAAYALAEAAGARSGLRWNAVADELRPAVESMVAGKALDESGAALPRAVSASIEWDLIHFLVQLEVAPAGAPDFFLKQAEFYLEGHFPCGWDGIFPDGRRVIY